MSTSPAPASRPRLRGAPIKGIVLKSQACLDFRSVLALDYAKEWLSRAGVLSPSPSAVMRRALEVYMDHLGRDATQAQEEAREVRRLASTPVPPPEDRQGPLQRLQDIQDGSPLVPYSDVLRGPQWRSAAAASDARLDELTAAALAGLRRPPSPTPSRKTTP